MELTFWLVTKGRTSETTKNTNPMSTSMGEGESDEAVWHKKLVIVV